MATSTRHERISVMGTVVTVDLFGDDEHSDALLAEAEQSLRAADELFSLWKPESPFSRIRRGALTIDDTPEVLRRVLDECRPLVPLSDGWFDPWSLPGGVDVTGYVKGWAAERAADILATGSFVGLIVNAAGDIATRGRDEDGEQFRVGIVSPTAPQTLAAAITLDGAVATSGSYERGAHLYNPKARHFGTKAASASVTGPNLGVADALATAVVCGGLAALEVVREIPHYEAMVTLYDETVHATEGFPFVGD